MISGDHVVKETLCVYDIHNRKSFLGEYKNLLMSNKVLKDIICA